MNTKIERTDSVAQTLFIPLYIKALESSHPDPIILDEQAVELVEKIDFDFSILKIPKITKITAAMRARQFDNWIRTFLTENPDGLVVDIGCGLDTRFHRVDNGKVLWYDQDLAEVIELREKLIAPTDRNFNISRSVFDFRWIDEIRVKEGKGIFFLAEGVLMYLNMQDVKRLFIEMRDRFPGSEIAFDACSRFMAKHSKQHPTLKATNLSFLWGINDGHEIESWMSGIRLMEHWSYFNQDEKRLGFFKLFRWIPIIKNLFKIYRFRFI